MRRHAFIIAFIVCAGAFGLGILQIFQVRVEQGDIYPPYSSLRADPLGAMALYESLERMPGVVVKRDYSSNDQLPESGATTYLHLAAVPRDWQRVPENLVKEIDKFLARGGRLVLTCEPDTADDSRLPPVAAKLGGTNSPTAKANKTGKPGSPEKPAKPGQPDDSGGVREKSVAKMTNLLEHWGFTVSYQRLPQGEEDVAEPVTVSNRSNPDLPASLAWHSATLFRDIAPSWRVVYARGSNAVVMERRFGAGSVVLASDSYFISNEALLRDRHADLLAWLVGSSRQIVFDEAHLGVVEQPGLVTLMRKYRLHGVIAGLAVLMGLFVWKNSTSLVPPPRRNQGRDYVAGRDSALGFVNLLRRSIPAGTILKVCYEQWEKSVPSRRDLAPSRIEQAKQAVGAELSRSALERDPISAYQQVSRILKTGGPAAPVHPQTQTTPS